MDFDWSVKVTDLAIIASTLISPFLAVQATEMLRARQKDYEAREQVFHALMSTRTARMAPMHVAALNKIDLVFPAKRFPKVSDAWTLYLAHLNTDRKGSEADEKAWDQTSSTRFYAMLRAMADAQKVSFSDTAMQHNGYYPHGYVFNEGQAADVRAAALNVLLGKTPIGVKPMPETEPDQHPAG